MTFPCKEELIELENFEKRQHRIYNDACDVGLLTSEFDREKMKSILRSMLEVFGKPEYHFKKEEWGCIADPNVKAGGGLSVEFFIPIEYDEGKKCGITVKVSNNIDRIRKKTFTTVETYRDCYPIS